MATKKVIFFTAGPKASAPELAAIAKLNAATPAPYSVKVFNGAQNPNYGYGKEAADYVAGTIPNAYSAVEVINPDDIPNQSLSQSQVIISDGQTVIAGGKGYQFHVVAGEIASISEMT